MQNDDAPGPWTRETRRGRTIIIDADRNEVCEAFAAPALIAAAPDLLAALELLLNVEGAARHGARLPGFVGLDVAYHFEAARAAIARATGA